MEHPVAATDGRGTSSNRWTPLWVTNSVANFLWQRRDAKYLKQEQNICLNCPVRKQIFS